jgi:hypothetical protein
MLKVSARRWNKELCRAHFCAWSCGHFGVVLVSVGAAVRRVAICCAGVPFIMLVFIVERVRHSLCGHGICLRYQ